MKTLIISCTLLGLVGFFAFTTNWEQENPTPDLLADCMNTPGTLPPSKDSTIMEFRGAMLAFQATLSPKLLKSAVACLDDPVLPEWSNLPASINKRDGINYGQLIDLQVKLFQNLLSLFLSADGYQKVHEITVLAENILHEQRERFWDPDKYYIRLFGDPVTSGSWGFQLDGHHCAINFLVHGDKVSMVPAFLGSEPVKGSFDGNDFDVIIEERILAMELYHGLKVSDGSSAQMVVGPPERGPDKFGGSYDYTQFAIGLVYPEMSISTQEKLKQLMKVFVYNLHTEFADKWWQDVMENIGETYFVWVDRVDAPSPETPFYFRIYNPYLWVEYNTEPPVGRGIEEWNHAHTITRIPNNPDTKDGGDYGIFAERINQGGMRTLYEHYVSAVHHERSELLFDYEVERKSGPKQHKHKHSHPH